MRFIFVDVAHENAFIDIVGERQTFKPLTSALLSKEQDWQLGGFTADSNGAAYATYRKAEAFAQMQRERFDVHLVPVRLDVIRAFVRRREKRREMVQRRKEKKSK